MFFVWILCKYSAVQYKMNIISKEFSMLRQGFNPRSEYDTIDEDGDALEQQHQTPSTINVDDFTANPIATGPFTGDAPLCVEGVIGDFKTVPPDKDNEYRVGEV
jgi:hypothetical protein